MHLKNSVFSLMENLFMIICSLFKKLPVVELRTKWLLPRLLLIIAAILGSASAKSAAYEFVASENPYNVSTFTAANNTTIPTLTAGFTVKNKATVNWNFDGKATSITGPIVVEAGGTLNITAHGQMKSEGRVLVNGALIITNSDIDSVGLSNHKSTITIGTGGTLIIRNSKNSSGVITDRSMAINGTLSIENSGTDSIGLFNFSSPITIGSGGLLSIINPGGTGLCNNYGTVVVDIGGLLAIANTEGTYGIHNVKGGTTIVRGTLAIALMNSAGIVNDKGTAILGAGGSLFITNASNSTGTNNLTSTSPVDDSLIITNSGRNPIALFNENGTLTINVTLPNQNTN